MPSTVIKSYDFDAAARILTIRFTSEAVYNYLEVPQEVYDAFRMFREKGVFYNQNIKGKYQFQRIDFLKR